MIRKNFRKLSNYQIIAIAYLLVILTGAAFLSLPISSKTGNFTDFFDALFTSTSATCVTGLVVYDTFTHWSGFGQAIILLLIQIGGMGFMTITTLFILFVKRHLTLSEKTLFAQSASAMNLGIVGVLIKQIALGTLIFEATGAALLAIRFIPVFGWGQGIWAAVFHSVSAFCNAGFDIMGGLGEFSSLAYFSGDVLVNLVIMCLIVIGGLGFLVWGDIIHSKFRFKKFSLHTTIVIWTTLILILTGAALYFGFEYNGAMTGMSFGQKIMAAFFQSITPRTAGFSTLNQAALSDSSKLLTITLMLIGGSSGSTAGGIKTTTFAVVLLTIKSIIQRKRAVNAGKRRLAETTVYEASSIFFLYLFVVVIATITLCAIEPYSLTQIMFEIVSAIGTVGLSTGITPTLTIASKAIIILLMYGGRVGVLSFAMIFANKKPSPPIERPVEKIIVG